MSWRIVACLAMLFSVAALAAASGPLPVSPGDAARFLGVASACPTFSWTAAEEVAGYELVVYAMPNPEVEAAVATAPDPDAAPVIRVVVPAGALSWTPPSESCLPAEGRFAWSVRAVARAGAAEWSEPALFKVESPPLLDRIGKVLEQALSRYLADRGIEIEPNGSLAALIADELGGITAVPPAPDPPTERIRDSGGKQLLPGEPAPRGVFGGDDVELTLVETGSGDDDYIQLVLDTPTATGSSAWNLAVRGDNGTLFLSGPTFIDAFQVDPTNSKFRVALLEEG